MCCSACRSWSMFPRASSASNAVAQLGCVKASSSLDDSLTEITDWLPTTAPHQFIPSAPSIAQASPSMPVAEPASLPPKIEYVDPFRKPTKSYEALIIEALDSTPMRQMTIAQMYDWIQLKYPFFQNANATWKVIDRVRHHATHSSCIALTTSHRTPFATTCPRRSTSRK